MTRIRPSRTLITRAHQHHARALRLALTAKAQEPDSPPRGYRHEQTDGWSNTERAWSHVYAPEQRPPMGFTPNT